MALKHINSKVKPSGFKPKFYYLMWMILVKSHNLLSFSFLICKMVLLIIMLLISYAYYKDEVKWSEVTQSCPTFCDPVDCSLPGSSVRGILQARTLKWVAISFSRRSSQPRDRTRVSRIAGRRFTVWATREATKPISWRIHPTSGLPTVSYPEATLGRGLSTSIQKQEAQL